MIFTTGEKGRRTRHASEFASPRWLAFVTAAMLAVGALCAADDVTPPVRKQPQIPKHLPGQLTAPAFGPGVTLTASPLHGPPGLTVTFRAEGTPASSAECVAKAYRWTFGDGSEHVGPEASHRFAKSGSYKVVVVYHQFSRDPDGKCIPGINARTVSNSVLVVVEEPPKQPIACFRIDGDVHIAGQPIGFYSCSQFFADPGTCEWTFEDIGEKTRDKTGKNFKDQKPETGEKTSHVYSRPGIYSVRLRVIDARGLSDETSQKITVVAPRLQACFSSPARVDVGETIAFDASCTKGTPQTTYAWQFSDGSVASGSRVERIASRPGRLTAHLTVTDPTMQSDVDEAIVFVADVPLEACFTMSTPSEMIGRPVVFDAACSHLSRDPDLHDVRYSWDFGDGSPPSFGSQATHSFTSAGRKVVRLTVEDRTRNLSAATDKALAVTDRRLEARFRYSPEGPTIGDTIRFDAGETVHSLDPRRQNVTYTWDWGDGSAPASGVRADHRFSRFGRPTVTLTVADGRGGSDRTSQTVVMTDQPPTAEWSASPASPRVGDRVTFDASGSRDPEGDTLNYVWALGDSVLSRAVSVTHVFTKAETARVVLTVTDAGGQAVVATAAVPILPRPLDWRIYAIAVTLLAAVLAMPRLVMNLVSVTTGLDPARPTIEPEGNLWSGSVNCHFEFSEDRYGIEPENKLIGRIERVP